MRLLTAMASAAAVNVCVVTTINSIKKATSALRSLRKMLYFEYHIAGVFWGLLGLRPRPRSEAESHL